MFGWTGDVGLLCGSGVYTGLCHLEMAYLSLLTAEGGESCCGT